VQVSGKTKFISDMSWEAMYSKLPDDPMGVNRIFARTLAFGYPQLTTATYDNLTVPYLFGLNFDWKIKEQGNIKINFMRVSENLNDGQRTTSFVGVPNFADTTGDGIVDTLRMNGRGNLWGWVDPWDYRNTATNRRPMRSNLTGSASTFVYPFISQQGQTSFGLSINYRFDPSNIRVQPLMAEAPINRIRNQVSMQMAAISDSALAGQTRKTTLTST